MRTLLATSLLVLSLGGLLALAKEPGPEKPAPRTAGKTSPSDPSRGIRTERTEKLDASREELALAFVRENHAELAELLEQLKAMKPDRYERAINELWQVSRTLANFKKNDEKRYQVALDVWKSKSRAELLAAQLVGTPSAALESQLRGALETQLGAELRQQRLERDLAKERLRKLDESIQRLEKGRDAQVESRYQTLLRKGQRARRSEAGQGAPSRPTIEKGENPE